MYLPRIMAERFGWAGFLAFAIPNVLGVIAFGFIVRTRERSQALAARHGRAMAWFSAVTIAYHMFFIVFLLEELVSAFPGVPGAPMGIAGVVLALGVVWSFLSDRDWLALSAIIYAISIGAFIAMGVDGLREIQWHGAQEPSALVWLAPTLAFGFLLCPYLDLTFHRALQRSSPIAFAAFGPAFAAMLLLTLTIWFEPRGVLSTWAVGHILAQSVFTVGAHLRELRLTQAIRSSGRRALAMLVPAIAAAPLLYVLGMLDEGPTAGENIYIRFLVWYGLVFPAYVAVFMPGPGRAGDHRGRFRAIAFAAAVLICLPLYEWGFIAGRTWMLAIALAVVAIAAIGVRMRGPAAGAVP